MTIAEVPARVKERIRGCQWTHEDLRVWSRVFGPAPDDGEPDTRKAYLRGLARRKCQWAERADAEAAVVFLSSKECLPYLKLCREDNLSGSDWEPVWAWFEQEDANRNAPRGGWLHQILRRKDADAGVDGPYVLEDGCKRRVTATFYWDVPDIPECPKSSSGIQYEVSVRGRDEDTGLYTCVVTCTETVRQDVPAYEAHEELGETRIRADALGLREDPDVEGGSTVDAKIEAYAEEQGLSLDDGAKTLDDGDVIGVVVDLQKQKNADCTMDITIQNTHEEKSERHVLEGRETIRGKQLTRTDIHLPADANEGNTEYPLVSPAVGALTVKRVEKTPGGVRNVTTTVSTSKALEAGESASSCARTLFEHVHSETAENAHSEPSREAGAVSLKTGAESGYYETVQVTRNDDGTYTTETRGTTELEVEEAQNVTDQGAIVSTVTEVGQNLTASTATTNDWKQIGETPSVSGESVPAAIGELISRTEQKTPGGVRNVTVKRQKAYPYVKTFVLGEDPSGASRKVTIFYNQTKTQVDTLAATHHSISVSKNAFGLYDGTATAHTSGGGGGDSGRIFPEYEVEYDATEVRYIKNSDGSLVKETRVVTYLEGITHDSDIASTPSSNSPFTKVNGCQQPRVDYLGNYYWKYSGITAVSVKQEYAGQAPSESNPNAIFTDEWER